MKSSPALWFTSHGCSRTGSCVVRVKADDATDNRIEGPKGRGCPTTHKHLTTSRHLVRKTERRWKLGRRSKDRRQKGVPTDHRSQIIEGKLTGTGADLSWGPGTLIASRRRNAVAPAPSPCFLLCHLLLGVATCVSGVTAGHRPHGMDGGASRGHLWAAIAPRRRRKPCVVRIAHDGAAGRRV